MLGLLGNLQGTSPGRCVLAGLQPRQKKKNLIAFDDLIAYIMAKKKFQSIIKELLIRCRKLSISLVFITKSYFLFQKVLG